MKILITGETGQLGSACFEEASRRGHETYALLPGFDITDKEQIDRTINHVRPDAVIHCAAITDVEGCEDLDNRPRAYLVNVEGTRIIAQACANINSKMVYISSDYVFDGSGTESHKVDDPQLTINYYGRTKQLGEQAASEVLDKLFIVRTSWLFGKSPNNTKKNFVKTMLQLSETKDEIDVVCDQVGTPTFTDDLSVLLVDMAESTRFGTYHATNAETNPGEYVSWADFAEEIFKAAKREIKVNRIPSEKFNSKVKRPKNSRLDKSELTKQGFKQLPDWRDAVQRYVYQLQQG